MNKKIKLLILLSVTSLLSFSQTYTTIQQLNVRSGKGANFGILGVINKGDNVELITNSDNWGEINYKGQTGFVSTKFLESSNQNTFGESKNGISKTLLWGAIIGIVLLLIFFRNTFIVRGIFRLFYIGKTLMKDGATFDDIKTGSNSSSRNREVYC